MELRAGPPHGRTAASAAFGLLLAFLLGCYFLLVVTDGTLHPGKAQELHSKIYAGQWRSLTHGHFDLDPSDVEGEAFHRDGKSYTYYGVFPALLRGAASVFVDPYTPGLTQISCALAGLIAVGSFLLAGVLVMRSQPFSKALMVLFGITLVLASPVVSGLALPHVYIEACLWGAAWACVFNASLAVFALSRDAGHSARAVLVMSVATGFALHSRLTAGAGAVLEWIGIVLWVAWDARRGRRLDPASASLRRAVALGSAIVFIFVSLQFVVNWQRWGDPLVFRPMERHELYENSPRNLAAAREQFRFDRLPTSACYYFMPHLRNFSGHWPFLRRSTTACFDPGSPPYVYRTAGMPLGIMSPLLLLFTLWGVARTPWRRWDDWACRSGWLLLLGGAVVSVAILSLDTLLLRYQTDFLPAFAALGLWGVVRTTALPQRSSHRNVFFVMVITLLFVSIYATHITMLIEKANGTGRTPDVSEAVLRFLGERS